MRGEKNHLTEFPAFFIWLFIWLLLCYADKFVQMRFNWISLLNCRKVFPLYCIHVPHFHLLYLLRHDGCWSHTFSTPGSCRIFCILLIMESPLRFSCFKTSKYYILLHANKLMPQYLTDLCSFLAKWLD